MAMFYRLSIMRGNKDAGEVLLTNEEMKMKLLAFLRNHAHYWGVPHPRALDNRLVQTCYECGAEREVKIELRPPSDQITLPITGDHIAA
jgi:hypothetical protein